MVTRRVVLITGAGASMGYGMPDGRELKARIVASLTDLNSPPNVCVRCLLGRESEHLDFGAYGQRLRRSPVPSIDAFLEVEKNSRHFMRAAKIMIAWHILHAECASQYVLTASDDDWLPYLFKKLIEGAKTPEALEANRVTILTFNFDRSIEFRWLDAVASHFDLAGGPDLARAFDSLPVHHVHGTVAPDLTVEGLSRYPLVRQVDETLVGLAADQVKLVHDQVPDTDAVEQALREAQAICFLGLSYAPLNLRRLKFPRHVPGQYSPPVYGTTLGMGAGEIDAAKRLVMGAALNVYDPTFMDVNCTELLRQSAALHL